MAKADYRLCDVCGEKAFYDANLNYTFVRRGDEVPSYTTLLDESYTLDYLGDWAVLCTECAKTHSVVIATLAARDDQQTIDEERATLAAIAQFAKAHGWTDAGEAPSLGEYIRLALAASVAGPAAVTDAMVAAAYKAMQPLVMSRALDYHVVQVGLTAALAASARGGGSVTDDGQGYGNCPVQITGEVEGHQFYFRARGTQFTLSFSPEGDTDEYAAVGEPPFLQGTIDREFAAGWMPHALAKALVDWGCEEFLAEKKAALAASARGAA